MPWRGRYRPSWNCPPTVEWLWSRLMTRYWKANQDYYVSIVRVCVHVWACVHKCEYLSHFQTSLTGCDIRWWHTGSSHSAGLGIGWLWTYMATWRSLQNPALYCRDISTSYAKDWQVRDFFCCCILWFDLKLTKSTKCKMDVCCFSLSEHGATSLGPAVLASVAVASRYPGSKVRGSKVIELTWKKQMQPSGSWILICSR